MEPLTLDELCTRVALALSVDYAGAPNERIRDVPDRRTIRYYTTLGLIDRPAAMRGRTALYGRRHLLQLVAIKRLQGQGLSLHEIQQRLLGQSDAALEQIAQLPDLPDTPPAATPEPPRSDFWKSVPEAATPMVTEESPAVLQAVPLDDALMLLAPLRRTPDAADREAIRVAAEPLRRLLELRRLI